MIPASGLEPVAGLGPSLLSVDQVAEHLAVPRRVVLELHRTGALPGVRLSRKALRFTPGDVALYVQARRTVTPQRELAGDLRVRRAPSPMRRRRTAH